MSTVAGLAESIWIYVSWICWKFPALAWLCLLKAFGFMLSEFVGSLWLWRGWACWNYLCLAWLDFLKAFGLRLLDLLEVSGSGVAGLAGNSCVQLGCVC